MHLIATAGAHTIAIKWPMLQNYCKYFQLDISNAFHTINSTIRKIQWIAAHETIGKNANEFANRTAPSMNTSMRFLARLHKIKYFTFQNRLNTSSIDQYVYTCISLSGCRISNASVSLWSAAQTERINCVNKFVVVVAKYMDLKFPDRYNE